MSVESLTGLVEKGIKLYNEQRAPEAVAELIKVEGDTIVVGFSGSFCMWCGIYDWVEDLVYVFREVGLETKLVRFVEPEDPTEPRRFGYFKIVSVGIPASLRFMFVVAARPHPPQPCPSRGRQDIITASPSPSSPSSSNKYLDFSPY